MTEFIVHFQRPQWMIASISIEAESKEKAINIATDELESSSDVWDLDAKLRMQTRVELLDVEELE